jgi:acetylornithine/succinyldiaminopimelate/putrescine aminotransferase
MLEAIDAGVLAIWANNNQETLLVMPPLVIEADDVDAIIDGLSTAAGRAGAA